MPVAIDLFSGCGGFSYGFQQAGFKVLLGIDNDGTALKTFSLNHPESTVSNLDLSKSGSIKQIQDKARGMKVDVVIAGPPCQGFSLTGPRRFDDKRNTLYLAAIKTVKVLQPKAFIIENVPGLAALYGGQVKNEIIRRFGACGFNVACSILCAANYGVPQLRRRVFFVGLHKEIGSFEFPPVTHTADDYITCSDAISDLPTREKIFGLEEHKYDHTPQSKYQVLMRKGAKVLYNHVATNHKDFVKEVISHVPEGKNYKALPKGVGDSRKFHTAWTRYHGQKPSPTIDTGHRNHFHYELNRVPTVRENARLQSFPDVFRFLGNRTQQNRQVGNAVPPMLGYHIAKKLMEYI